MTLQESPSGTLRWGVGIAFAALLHLCGAMILLRIPAPSAPLEPVMMLELAPATQAPAEPTPAEEAAPSQPQATPEPEAAQPPPPEPVPAPQALPESPPPEPRSPDTPVQEAPPPEPPSPQPEPEFALPETPDLPTPPVPIAPATRPVARPAPRPPAVTRTVSTPQPVQPVQPATPPPPAAAAHPPAAQPSAQALADWRSRLLAHLNRFKRYPAAALMRRTQGVAYVHLLLMPDGTAKDVRLQTSSGAALLDEEALALIARAVPMPPRPDSGPTELVVPIQFAVR